ncbi:phenylalanine--tRNA ligase subunit alpha [candidate division WWE3 bacterium CG10_big_fil_rev_8_21_14_0_10_32_10]|uniref:phenylalanine--tRNA ligase n=1 Tax=candidate division WWE3 bacterium CG10_big_fil_rev_8_21_14_0_10_32_10 TaxID=1975090 RepID=A0A2H0R944_UNCKA|nr:MAG: phenylalanine--tRNA ligase subunit alpha [candidate division WWE3 bacterium CG10_big_fil_rev_8_21_14_0_10_32_10]
MQSIDIEQEVKDLDKKIKGIKTKEDLENIRIEYLGRNGKINKLGQEVKNIPDQQKSEFGKKLNEYKKTVTDKLYSIKISEKKEESYLNISAPVKTTPAGNFHPTTLTTQELNKFFNYYGFSVLEGPEIENDFYNFEMMGVPKNHPARELQDTLYIKEPELLLRTQTSNEEARILEKKELPIRVVIPGKVYRNETANKTNGAVFYQYQGVYVDVNVTMGNLKWIFEKALKFILGEDTTIRFRSKYYPEVEPGLSPDIQCKFCHGNGCEICKYRGWIEIAGGGMIHPTTLTKAGIDNKKYSGFAFGWGLDRVVMQKYNIPDQRLLYSGNIIYDYI